MKYQGILLFFCLPIIHQNSFCMEASLNGEVSESMLQPWNEKIARPNSLVAYKDGMKFRYAQLHGKAGENAYSIITALYSNGTVKTSHGKVVSGSCLRLIATEQS